VVKVGTTDTAENAGFVELEARLIGFNGNTDRLSINSRAQSVFSVGHILVASDFTVSRDGAGRGLASAIFSSVGVSSLSAETVGFNVFEGVVHKTTRAAEVSITL